MHELAAYVDGLPNLSGSEALIEAAVAAARERPVFLGETRRGWPRSTAPSRSPCTCTSR